MEIEAGIQASLDAIAADADRGEMVFPTHSDIPLQVRRLLDDPDCSIEQLSKLISAEPLLSAKVVSVANSVAYNPSGRTSSDVRSALSRIGFNTLRSLSISVIVKQMQGMSSAPEHRALAARLWEHTTHVAALARVIAKRVTHQDPEAAFFAGIIHEVGGFYLLSRASAYPELLKGELDFWQSGGEAQIGRTVIKALNLPESILVALEVLWDGFLAMPPVSLGDTLLLADNLSPIPSPLSGSAGRIELVDKQSIELLIGDDTLSNILAESAEEVASLTAALKA
jgi:HD-like signal output (HDOD) protein